MIQKVYKIVQRHPAGDYMSCRTAMEYGGVIYRVGRWAIPRIHGAPLLAFKDLSSVRGFVIKCCLEEDLLFEAEALVFKEVCYVCRHLDILQAFWERRPPERSFPPGYAPAPQGTPGCAAIRLVREIDWSHA